MNQKQNSQTGERTPTNGERIPTSGETSHNNRRIFMIGEKLSLWEKNSNGRRNTVELM